MTGFELARLGDADLELALRDLGRSLETRPPRVDLARAARLRLEAPAARSRWIASLGRRPVRRAVLIALAALLVLAGLAAALGFGLPGLRIIFVGETASPPVGSPFETLDLGRLVPLESLDAEARFDVLVPEGVGLDGPIAAVQDLRPGVRQASLVYPPTPRHPAGNVPSVGILITQLPGSIDEELVVKFIQRVTTFERVTVDGQPGYWIAGGLHAIGYLDADGEVVVDSIRLTGNVLAWNANGVTYRIEGARDLETARSIAAALR
ncbi:MAG: hypothetical protein FIA92_05800 [Chloroflexi bacterium]|nr:hypothetical protein [Chloroflexota bacterium]